MLPLLCLELHLIYFQERKLEIYDAIVKIEQGGTADGLLQVNLICTVLSMINKSSLTLCWLFRHELIIYKRILKSL